MDNLQSQEPQDPINVTEELRNVIHNEAHHVAAETFNSPEIINRVVGEAMRHIGGNLTNASAAYLRLNMGEVLIPPEPMEGQDTRGLVLIKRQYPGDNAFQVLVTAKKAGEFLEYSFTAFKFNPDDLSSTQFLNLPEELRKELIRQFSELIKKEGSIILQAILANNFFPAEPKKEALPGIAVEESVM